MGKYVSDLTFAKLTTMGVGGKIKKVFYPDNEEELIKFLKSNKEEYLILGNGSNVIAGDKDYDGVVIKLNKMQKILNNLDDTFIVSSNVLGIEFAKYVISKGYIGCEFMGTIPGSIGGMIYMNAGCYSNEVSDYFIEGEFIDKDYNLITLTKEELEFSYRKSKLQKEKLICLKAKFKFDKGKNNNLEKFLKQRKETQPQGVKNAGSTFKNLENISVWKLIDTLNLKGLTLKDAMISEKHGNFIVNKGNAKSQDIVNLIKIIQENILLNYGIHIICEWEFINIK